MLHRQKFFKQLDKIRKNIFIHFAQGQDIAQSIWHEVKNDQELSHKIRAKKYSLLIPYWSGILGSFKNICKFDGTYSLLSVDGSQIYYDKHQGLACYLINIGSVYFKYIKPESIVRFCSNPYIFTFLEQESELKTADTINLKREKYELQEAVEKSIEYKKQSTDTEPFLCMFDGSLIFFQAEGAGKEKQCFLEHYLSCLQMLYDHQILHVGYISFPRSKELVNILKLSLVQFDEKELRNSSILDQLSDMDIASFFLQIGQRSLMFESKMPISYLYPQDLKPYFCFFHVGFEIIRLEFPAWIAQNEKNVDQICSLVLDQVEKGKGYPVSLFEAHEQAVIKAQDRDFFYSMMQNMSEKEKCLYKESYKSIKKRQIPI